MEKILFQIVDGLLPSGYRVQRHSMFIDYPNYLVPIEAYPPVQYFLQKARRPGFLGLFRGWENIGEIDHSQNALCIFDEYFEDYSSKFDALLSQILNFTVLKGRGKPIRQYETMMCWNRPPFPYFLVTDEELDEQ